MKHTDLRCHSCNLPMHPFDDPLVWRGHAILIDEIFRAGLKPDAIVLSVGGGRLLCGVIEGLKRNGGAVVPSSLLKLKVPTPMGNS